MNAIESNTEIEFIILNTPLGDMIAGADGIGISVLEFLDADKKIFSGEKNISTDASENMLLQKLKTQLADYFSGERKTFDLSLSLSGTDFQKRVWNELQKIPFGKTRSYKEQTLALGNMKAIRAVASANGANPIAIIIPCHRVIGEDGKLTGYAGGLWRKKALVDLEKNFSSDEKQLSLLDEQTR